MLLIIMLCFYDKSFCFKEFSIDSHLLTLVASNMFVLSSMHVIKDQSFLGTHCRLGTHFCAVFKVRTYLAGYCIQDFF